MRTVGVEEELLLIDSGGSTVPLGEDVSDAGGDVLEHEFTLEQTEIETSPCATMSDVRGELVARRRDAADAAATHGARVVALGTSPLRAGGHITPDDRYARMAATFGEIARTQLTCGQHVHVSVESRDEGVGVLDRIREWLPILRALTANSPFWQGVDSGYASFRTIRWSEWPSAGPTPVFEDVAAYDDQVRRLIDCGAALDAGMIYFDARLSANFPTVEIRVADVCTNVDDSVAVAALARALVETAARAWQRGGPVRRVSQGLLRGWTWRAARYGMAQSLVHPGTGGLVPAWGAVDGLLELVGTALRDADDDELVTETLRRIRTRGTGADQQRAAHSAVGPRRMVLDAADRTLNA